MNQGPPGAAGAPSSDTPQQRNSIGRRPPSFVSPPPPSTLPSLDQPLPWQDQRMQPSQSLMHAQTLPIQPSAPRKGSRDSGTKATNPLSPTHKRDSTVSMKRKSVGRRDRRSKSFATTNVYEDTKLTSRSSLHERSRSTTAAQDFPQDQYNPYQGQQMNSFMPREPTVRYAPPSTLQYPSASSSSQAYMRYAPSSAQYPTASPSYPSQQFIPSARQNPSLSSIMQTVTSNTITPSHSQQSSMSDGSVPQRYNDKTLSTISEASSGATPQEGSLLVPPQSGTTNSPRTPGSNPISPGSVSMLSNYYNMADVSNKLQLVNADQESDSSAPVSREPSLTKRPSMSRSSTDQSQQEILGSPMYAPQSSVRDRRLQRTQAEALTIATNAEKGVVRPDNRRSSASTSSLPTSATFEGGNRSRNGSSPGVRPTFSTRRRNNSTASMQASTPNSSNGSINTPGIYTGMQTELSPTSSQFLNGKAMGQADQSLNGIASANGQLGGYHLFDNMYDGSSPMPSPAVPMVPGGADAMMGAQSRGGALAAPDPPPSDAMLRPFWLMRLLERTMVSGGYLTRRLYVPKQMWYQHNVKLHAIEAKLSACDALVAGLSRLRDVKEGDMVSLQRELEVMDGMLDGIQNSLAKKLTFIEGANGKRGKEGGLLGFGSKLSRSFDKMSYNNNKQIDSADAYVDALVRVFQLSQILDYYLKIYAPGTAGLEVRLRRCSEFFGNVVCRFVVRDLGILVDKYVKRGATWVSS